jgi:glycyl-tRNA synthetase (class II)
VEKVNSENIEKLEQTLKGKFFYDQSFSIYGGMISFKHPLYMLNNF